MFQPSKHVREQQQLAAAITAVVDHSSARADATAAASASTSTSTSVSVPLSPSRSFLRPPSLGRRDSRSCDSDEGFVLLSPRAHLPDSNGRADQLEGAADGARPSSLRSPAHSRSSSHTTRIFSGAPTLVLPPESISPFSPLYPSPSSAIGAQAAGLVPLSQPLQSRPLPHSSSVGTLCIPPLFRGATDFAMPGASPAPGASPRAHAGRPHAHAHSPQPAQTESIATWMKVALKPAPALPVANKQPAFRPAPSFHEDEEDEELALHDQWEVSALAHRGGGKARLRVAGGSGINAGHESKAHKKMIAQQRQMQEQQLAAYAEEPEDAGSAAAAKRAQQRQRAQRQRETQQAVARARHLTHSVRLTPESNESLESEVSWSQPHSQALVAESEDQYERWLRAWNRRVARGEVRDTTRRKEATVVDNDDTAALRHLREMREEELEQYLSYLALADEHARHVDQRAHEDDEAADLQGEEAHGQPAAAPSPASRAGPRGSAVVRLADPRARAAALAAPFDSSPLHAHARPPPQSLGAGSSASGGISALLRPEVHAAGMRSGGPFQRVWAKHHMTKNMTANKKCKRMYNHPVKPKSARQMETLNSRRSLRTDAYASHGLETQGDDEQQY